MTAIHETTYPRLRAQLTDQQLQEWYTPIPGELKFVERQAQSHVARLGLLVLLKTLQRLGYFPSWAAIPLRLVVHLAATVGVSNAADAWQKYEHSQFRWQHRQRIRQYLRVNAYSDGGRRVLLSALVAAAQSKDLIADIINCGLEALLHARYELPAFSTLVRAAGKARAQVNRYYYQQVYDALNEAQLTALRQLLMAADDEPHSQWQRLKQEPQRPTTQQLRNFIPHLRWLQSLNGAHHLLDAVPETKLQRFVDEARALNVNRLNDTPAPQRFTLAVALIRARTAQALDDVAAIVMHRVSRLHQRAQEAVDAYRQDHQTQVDTLIALLGEIADYWHRSDTPQARLQALEGLIGAKAEVIGQPCPTYLGFAGNNYLPFLLPFYRSQCRLCFEALALLQPPSTSSDNTLEQALQFLLQHRRVRAERLAVARKTQGTLESTLDWSWIPPRWWNAVTGLNRREVLVETVDRRYFELCLFSCVVRELKSGDLYIAGSEQFGDYRRPWLSWPQYEAQVTASSVQGGITIDPDGFVDELRHTLSQAMLALDAGFPDNDAITIQDGEPVIRRLDKQPDPENFTLINRLLRERLPVRNIVEVLADTGHWLNWTQRFGPLSGFEARLGLPRKRYVTTTFCYGCYLGPAQTARAMKDTDRRQVAYVNQYHITEQNLLDANVAVINAYNRFTLPKLWGSGRSASADGTQWDVYEQNLLSEYHIRYGGWGGIGYYHVADTYIALFSRFIACGVWEAV